MAIIIYKPNDAGRRRGMSKIDNSDLSKVKPAKRLTQIRKESAGRNNSGKITVRHKGAGAKQRIRKIDFKGDKFDILGRVKTIEYDPNRNARIALVVYADGDQRYLLAPEGLKVGDKVIASITKFVMGLGNRFTLEMIPQGTAIYNVEIEPGKGGTLARAAGSVLLVQAIEGRFAQVKMPSGEIRLLPKNCLASIGQVSNVDWRNIRWGKAGRMRHRGIRPTVRGKVMNPVDHPHGGGEARNPIGLKGGPKNIWGKKALGVKTRQASKPSSRLIIKRRNKN
jgi:large subunit ribosomal protein L2